MLRVGTRLNSGQGSVLEFCVHCNGPSSDAEARTVMSPGTFKLLKDNLALEVDILCQ